jgi:hypothetical protein
MTSPAINGWALPPFVCEKEPGTDDDCVFCTGVAEKLAHDPGSVPATLAEAEAIRAAAGIPAGPAGSDDLIRGCNARYGWAPTLVAPGFTALWAALQPGVCAGASGDPADAPGTPFARFVTERIGHRVFVGRYDTTDRVWLIDPEGPADGTYHGQWATKADLALFVKNGNSHTVTTMAREDDMKIGKIVGTDYKAINGILRAAPDTTLPAIVKLAAGAIVRSIAQVGVPGSLYAWCMTEYNGAPAYLVAKKIADGSTPDWAPVVPLDPAVDAGLSDYIARKPAPSTGATPEQVAAAVLAARQKQYDADLAAANADPVSIGPRP